MERRKSPFWREMTKLSTESGTPSAPSWQWQSWAVWTRSHQARSQVALPPGGLGITIFRVSDAVSFSHLLNLAKKRTNITPVIEETPYPHKYCRLIAMMDVIFVDMAQPDQT
jgi:hypothetical protein